MRSRYLPKGQNQCYERRTCSDRILEQCKPDIPAREALRHDARADDRNQQKRRADPLGDRPLKKRNLGAARVLCFRHQILFTPQALSNYNRLGEYNG